MRKWSCRFRYGATGVLAFGLVSTSTGGETPTIAHVLDSLRSVRSVGEVAISPDGKRLVFAQVRTGKRRGADVDVSTLWVMNALISALFPVLAKKSSATPFFFFATMMLIDFILVAAIYPETKGVSLEQLEQKLGVAD